MKKFKRILAGAALVLAFGPYSTVNVSPMINLKRALIDKYILEYSTHTREVSRDLNKINERKSLYIPLAEKYAKKFKDAGIRYNNIPLDNKKDLLHFLNAHEYVESKGNLECVSTAGAKGPRQFLYSTAKDYGLKIDEHIDERINPEKSARAALDYILRYAKAYNKSADLALAAYNGNPKNVERALAKYPGLNDDLDIPKGYLRGETVQYVPRIDAMYAMLKNPEGYGLSINSKERKFYMHTVKRGDTLSRLAHKYHSNEKLIAEYNGLKNSKIRINNKLIIPKNY